MRRKISLEFTRTFGCDYGWMLREGRVTEAELTAAFVYFYTSKAMPAKWRDRAMRGRWRGCREFLLSGAADKVIIYRRFKNSVKLLALGAPADFFPPKSVPDVWAPDDWFARTLRALKEWWGD